MNKGVLFEQQCIEKLVQIGFERVSPTPESTDYGVDIIAYHHNLKYIFQCKDWKKRPGESAVREILAAKQLFEANRCVVISKTGFTEPAYKLAKPNFIILIKGDDLFNAVNIFDLFEKSFEPIQEVVPINHNYSIIYEFEKLKIQLGDTPSLDELGKSLRYQIKKQYKNYSTFLKSIGERSKNSKPTKIQIMSEYKRIRDLLGKTPTAQDIRNNTNMPYNSFHTFPLTKLQKECGDIPNCDRSYTKEDLIEEYLALEKKLGHKPNGSEIDKYGNHNSHLYIRAFGSLTEFYKDPRINAEHLIKQSLKKHDIIILYTLLEELFNYINIDFPTSIRGLEQITYMGKPLLKAHQIEYVFKSINNFVLEINNDENIHYFKNAIKVLLKEFQENNKVIKT